MPPIAEGEEAQTDRTERKRSHSAEQATQTAEGHPADGVSPPANEERSPSDLENKEPPQKQERGMSCLISFLAILENYE